jgi:hypothetical protein
MIRFSNRCLYFLMVVVGAPSTAAAPAPDVLFLPESPRVAISGLTPGGGAAVLGVSRLNRDSLPTIVRTPVVLADDDADGTVALDAEVTPNSVWIAVDLANGAAVAVAPPGGVVRDGTDLQPVVERESSTAMRRLRAQSKLLDLLVVRPGRGVWYGFACDGGGGDADATHDGLLRLDRSAFRRLAGSGDAPDTLGTTDLVVAVDPETLRVVTRRIGQLAVEEVQ